MTDPAGARSLEALDLARLEKLVQSFDRIRLLVVGDVVLDEYLWGNVERVSPEAPVPIVHVDRETVVLGGAGNVLRNVVALGGGGCFASAVGSDADGAKVSQLIGDLGVSSQAVFFEEGRPTTRKTRVVARGQQIIRFDRETRRPVSEETARALRKAVSGLSGELDGAIFADYGKGVFSESLTAELMGDLSDAGVPVSVDPKRVISIYSGASLVKPNGAEARAFAGVSEADDVASSFLAERVCDELGDVQVVVTLGDAGMDILDKGHPVQRVSTMPREVFDVQGAGDTTIAALTLALRAGATLLEAAVIANAASGIVVAKMGTATASQAELRGMLPVALRCAQEAP